MNTRTLTYILGAVIVLILIRKTKKKMDIKKGFIEGLEYLRYKFGLTLPEAIKLEQQYRLETAHFKSGQFKGTYSPGMEKFGDTFPYGWKSLNKYFWSKHPEHAPKGFHQYTEGGTGKTKYFLKFPTLISAMATTLHNARMKGGKFEAWYSNNEDAQKRYLDKLNSIKARYVKDVRWGSA